MANHRLHVTHHGERILQTKRNTPEELCSQIPRYIQTDMPQQHAIFFETLSYFPIGALDENGRPWATMLVTTSDEQETGIKVVGRNELEITGLVQTNDPFVQAVTETEDRSERLFAGVGIDFTNRRRNKLAGVIRSARLESSEKLTLRLRSENHLGNCPKYITIRTLAPRIPNPKTLVDERDSFNSALPTYCREHIEQVSTVFIATKHTKTERDADDDQSDMGFNHRGGNPGFVRVYDDVDPENGSINTYLILPDFSGNRFYQSLGNIESDPEVGLVFPDFQTGDVFYITGTAENLFDEQAESLMQRSSLITRIKIEGAVFIQDALALRLTSQEAFSPYNPQIRYLTSELEQFGRTTQFVGDGTTVAAQLVEAKSLTPAVSTFTFELSDPISPPMPGGFGVFDFSDTFDEGYSHMNDERPQKVNDDYIRTWTFSSSPPFHLQTNTFERINRVDVTVKHKPGGLISSFLHQFDPLSDNVEAHFLGSGGGFSCFEQQAGTLPRIPERMLWVAGGVGITPFMAMWDGIRELSRAYSENNQSLNSEILLMFACSGRDLDLLRHFASRDHADSIQLLVRAFHSGTRPELESSFETLNRRMNIEDFVNIDQLPKNEVYLCGPDTLTRNARTWLEENAVPASQIHHETFYF